MMDDQALLRRMGERDVAAFGAFYDRHAGCLFSLALRVLRHEPNPEVQAEDVLLTVLTDLWHQPPPGRPKSVAFLIQRVRQLALARRTVAWSPTDDSARSTDQFGLPRCPLDHFRRLSPLQRTVLELAFFEGLSVEEISAHLNESQASIRRALADGIRGIKAHGTSPLSADGRRRA